MPEPRHATSPWPSYLVGSVALALTGGDVVAHHFAIAWIDLAGFLTSTLAYASHRIIEVSLQYRGAGISITQQLERTERVARTAIANRGAETEATNARLGELDRLQALLQQPGLTDDVIEAVMRFINSRLEDLAGWVAEEDEDVRAALWWWSAEARGLRIVAAPRITDAKTLGHVFHVGEGILGRVYREPQIWNVPDAPALGEWIRIADVPPRYHGLLCLPVELGGIAGVLTVDRTQPIAFDHDSVGFAEQTVRLIGIAIGTPRAQSAFRAVNALPAQIEVPPRTPTPSGVAPDRGEDGGLPH